MSIAGRILTAKSPYISVLLYTYILICQVRMFWCHHAASMCWVILSYFLSWCYNIRGTGETWTSIHVTQYASGLVCLDIKLHSFLWICQGLFLRSSKWLQWTSAIKDSWHVPSHCLMVLRWKDAIGIATTSTCFFRSSDTFFRTRRISFPSLCPLFKFKKTSNSWHLPFLTSE